MVAAKTRAFDPKVVAVPAVFVNSFQMTVLGTSVVRLTFGEQANPQSPPVYRTAILLGIEDARQFFQQVVSALSAPQGKPS
jgi:hypothetical protein